MDLLRMLTRNGWPVLVVLTLCLKRPPAPPKADYVRTLAPVKDKAATAASDYVGKILDKAKLTSVADLEPEWAANMPPHLRNMYSSSLLSFAKLKSARVGDVRADPSTPGVCVVECVGENNRRLLVRIRAVENDKLGLVSIAALR